ncbi:hypothetical protein JCM1393_15480 [Clostridium carnis]
MVLGKYIKQIRCNKNITLKELSELTGVSESYLSRIENGVKTNPTTSVIERIQEVLGVDILDRKIVFITTELKGIRVILDDKLLNEKQVKSLQEFLLKLK